MLLKSFHEKILSTVLVVSIIASYWMALMQPVLADDFYYSGGYTSECHLANVVGVQYNSIGGNGVNWNASEVEGKNGSWVQSHRFLDVSSIAYPDAHRYPYIADKVSIPPNTQIDIGFWGYSYAGHGVNVDSVKLFTSRPDISRGDLTKLGAGGTYGTISMVGYRPRSGKYITTGYVGYYPDRTSSLGKVIYSFNTIQPMQVQSFTAEKSWQGQDLIVTYTLQLKNTSTYNLNNIRVRDVMPSGAVYDQTFSFSSSQTRTITYSENWGSNYPSRITNDSVTITDPNSHTETQSEVMSNISDINDPTVRPAVALRDDNTAPSSWNSGQPVWGQIDRPPIIVELIPYWFDSPPVSLDINPELSVEKLVSDEDETLVKENNSRPTESITYDIQVENTGGRATNVVLTDDYDQDLITITDSDGGIDNGDTITWNVAELQHNESISFSITADVISPLTHGEYDAPNIITVDSDQTNPIEDSTNTNITAEVRMEIDKTVSDSDETSVNSNHIQGGHPETAERKSTYSIYIENSGDADAHLVTIIDDVSEVIRYGSIQNISNNGILTTRVENGLLVGEITWDIGDLPQGENSTVTFDVLFNTGIDDLADINNIAEVRTNEVDPISDSTVTIIHSPILNISKDDGVDYAEANDLIHWSITAENIGTGNAYNVEVYDFLPDKSEISSISDDGVLDLEHGRIVWSTTEPDYILNGSYNPDPRSTWGTSKTITFDAKLDPKFPDGDEVLVNKAILEADFENQIEAEHELPILTPILEIVKSQKLPEVVAPSQPITYTITYRNIGTGSSPNTVITDTLPTHTQFIEFIQTDNQIVGVYDSETNLITWDLGTLNVGEEGSVSFKVVIEIPTEGGTEIINKAIIDSPSADQVESEVITSTVDACCLGGFIWEDSNQNGVYDSFEKGIPNAKLHISWGETEFLEGEQIEIFTDSSGHYEYTGLPYHTVLTVSVDIPDGYDEITTDYEYKLVLLPPKSDGIIEDYELEGIRYLTAGQCISFLDAGIYRDIILAQTGQSIIPILIIALGLISLGSGIAILSIKHKRKNR